MFPRVITNLWWPVNPPVNFVFLRWTLVILDAFLMSFNHGETLSFWLFAQKKHFYFMFTSLNMLGSDTFKILIWWRIECLIKYS